MPRAEVHEITDGDLRVNRGDFPIVSKGAMRLYYQHIGDYHKAFWEMLFTNQLLRDPLVLADDHCLRIRWFFGFLGHQNHDWISLKHDNFVGIWIEI